MSQKTWPRYSQNVPYTSLKFTKSTHDSSRDSTKRSSYFCFTSKPSVNDPDFSTLPYDVITRIACSFDLPTLRAASLACRAWRDALKPLREAMLFLKWGKRFKHGRGGVRRDLGKALESFTKGAARGSTLAMVDLGLVLWETGKRDEAVAWYKKAADLGNVAGMCNLGISCLQANPRNAKEAIKWLYEASLAGHVRAQYQLALCFHQGQGVVQSPHEAARWYLEAAEGGYARAMYNTSLCYSRGAGLPRSLRSARKWMNKAADCGHSKAQFERGLTLFSEGDMLRAVVYLELATRAGERGASNVKNIVLQRLSSTSRDRAMHLVDNWRALPSSR